MPLAEASTLLSPCVAVGQVQQAVAQGGAAAGGTGGLCPSGSRRLRALPHFRRGRKPPRGQEGMHPAP